jgi:hypothetical protein
MERALILLAAIFLLSFVAFGQQPATDSNTAAPVASPSLPTTTPTLSSTPASSLPGGRGVVLPPEKAQPVRLQRFEKPPVIDGKLDDEAWKSAAVLKDFYQVQPGDNIAPSKPTEVLIGYDSTNIYIGFHAYDDPERVRVTVPKRDQILNDDYVGVLLDTYDDQRKAYALYFNPLGVQQDGILTESQGIDYNPDFLMESKGLITTDGYTLEVAIPFKSLRYKTGKELLWGVHAYRHIKRFNDEESSWMPRSRERSGTLNQEGHIVGFEGIWHGRTLELIPSLTISETGNRLRTRTIAFLQSNPSFLDPGRFLNEPVKADPGLTAKFGITPNMTLDLALNPDFAQIEADALVVRANQRFPIFYPEKRPFFLEGVDIFQTLINTVNTRTIVDPDVAVKLSGKSGRNSFGLLVASDNAPGNFTEEERTDPAILPFIERFIDKNSYIGVLRLKRDVGKENSIGLLATTYNFIEQHNHVGSVDGRFRLDPQTTFEFQLLGTNSRNTFDTLTGQETPYTVRNGFGYGYSFAKQGRHLRYGADGEGRTRNYRADVGFTRRVNTNYDIFNIGYFSEPNPNARLTSWRVVNYASTNFDWQGRLQYWNNETQAGANFKKQTYFRVGFAGGYERVFEEEFGPPRTATGGGSFAGPDPERSAYLKNVFAYGSTTPNKQISLFVLGGYKWGQLDFDFGGGPKYARSSPAALLDPNAPLDPGAGNQLELSASLTYQPTAALQNSLDYSKTKLTRRDTGLVAFNDNILSLRSTYQFTRFTFLRARVDYESLFSNISGQFLLGWTPNPGTSFYVGYNDDLNRNFFSPFTGQFEPGFRRNGRTFFIKVSYLFQRNL